MGSNRKINLTVQEPFPLPPDSETLNWVDIEALRTRSIYCKTTDITKTIPVGKDPNHNSKWIIVPPGTDGRICSQGKPGNHFLPVYKILFTEIGLRLPLSKFEQAVLRHLKVGLSQLHPNAWGFIRSFELVCRTMGFTITVKTFFHVFNPFPSKDSNGGFGWLSLRSSNGLKLFKAYADSMKGFKDKYLFLRPMSAVEGSILNKDGKPLFPLYWNRDHFNRLCRSYSYGFESLSESERKTVRGIIDLVKDIPENRIDCRAILSVRRSEVKTILVKMKEGKDSILDYLKRRKSKREEVNRKEACANKEQIPAAQAEPEKDASTSRAKVPSPRTRMSPLRILPKTISGNHLKVVEVVDDDEEAAEEPPTKKAKMAEPGNIMELEKIGNIGKSSSIITSLGRMYKLLPLKEMNELLENGDRRKRMADLIGKAPKEDPTCDPPPGFSRSPRVQIPGSSEGLEESWTSFSKEINETVGGCIKPKFIELQNKLSEFEKKLKKLDLEKSQWIAREKDLMENIAQKTSLNAEVNKLKKDLAEISLEKRQWIAREKNLMEENFKIKSELQTKEDAHKVTVDKLKAEIALQHKAGYDKAVKDILSSISGFKR